MILGHRIVALVGSQPARVICMTCGSEHNYRKASPNNQSTTLVRRSRDGVVTELNRGGTKKSETARASNSKPRTSDWEDRVLGQPVTAFTRYSITRSLSQGELVSHPKFGDGYVATVLEGNKVAIVFRDGPRTLTHSQPA